MRTCRDLKGAIVWWVRLLGGSVTMSKGGFVRVSVKAMSLKRRTVLLIAVLCSRYVPMLNVNSGAAHGIQDPRAVGCVSLGLAFWT